MSSLFVDWMDRGMRFGFWALINLYRREIVILRKGCNQNYFGNVLCVGKISGFSMSLVGGGWKHDLSN